MGGCWETAHNEKYLSIHVWYDFKKKSIVHFSFFGYHGIYIGDVRNIHVFVSQNLLNWSMFWLVPFPAVYVFQMTAAGISLLWH